MKTTASSFEPLEARIAPASVLHYTDVDGDKVTVTSSVGDLTGKAIFDAGGHQLELLNLVDPSFDHANLAFSVVRAPGGDGLAAVGRISGGTNDFGRIVIEGDLGVLDAGSNTPGVLAVKSLSVRSIGAYGLATQGGTGDLKSDIFGELGALSVTGDVTNALISVSHSNGVAIGTINIGGSLIGGAATSSGEIFTPAGDIGAIKIGHDVRGGLGNSAGRINASGAIAGITIGGSLIGGFGSNTGLIAGMDIGNVTIGHSILGGTGSDSATVTAGGTLGRVHVGGAVIGGMIASQQDMGAVTIRGDLQGFASGTGVISCGGELAAVTVGGSVIGGTGFSDSGAILGTGGIGPVKIGRDLRGGTGGDSGKIDSRGRLASVTIGGSLIGGSFINGAASNTGVILSAGDMGAVKIGGDVLGGSIFGGNSLDGSGAILSDSSIAAITIGGSIVSGFDGGTGSLKADAAIGATGSIGSLKVRGALIGNSNANGDSPVVVSALGLGGTITSPVVIGRISVGGRVERALILGGYFAHVDPAKTSDSAGNGNAQLGPITVGGDWVASSAVAGVEDVNGDGFGNGDDAVIANIGATLARIASITIKGLVAGTDPGVNNADHFGFVAEEIGAFSATGTTAVLHAGGPPLDVIELSPLTGDVTIREV